MLDELPSLELAASAVALVLCLRVVVLLGREAGLVRGKSRVESARARDLVGLAILAGAVLYVIRVERASSWFLAASGIAIVAQLAGFYFRAAASKRTVPGAVPDDSSEDENEPDEDFSCATCGNASLVELVDTSRYLGGLSQLSALSAAVCPVCGSLSGQLEDVSRLPVGAEHGTALRIQQSSGDQEALEEPQEHDG